MLGWEEGPTEVLSDLCRTQIFCKITRKISSYCYYHSFGFVQGCHIVGNILNALVSMAFHLFLFAYLSVFP